MKICPGCRHKNREGYMYCEDCGEEIAQIESVADSWASSAEPASIALQVNGAGEAIDLKMEARTVLGRFDPERDEQPDVDLNHYKAFENGVSVRHAEIQHDTEGVKIMDIGSRNGTYVNGRKLVPNQFYKLRDGDELRLSKLVATIHLRGIHSLE